MVAAWSTSAPGVSAQLREQRKLTIAGLAARCAALGAPALTAQVLYKMEGVRDGTKRHPRAVTVDELLTLALALNVAPVHLLVPVDGDTEPYQVTSTETAERARVRAWIRGNVTLAAFPLVADSRQFYAEQPASDIKAARQIARALAKEKTN